MLQACHGSVTVLAPCKFYRGFPFPVLRSPFSEGGGDEERRTENGDLLYAAYIRQVAVFPLQLQPVSDESAVVIGLERAVIDVQRHRAQLRAISQHHQR